MQRKRLLILGAGGRDFHNFNLLYRHRGDVEVMAFTAAQIPFQQGRLYPPELAGPLYPKGIPIVDEGALNELIRRLHIDLAVFSYSDISHARLMDLASRVVAAGCDFQLAGVEHTMLDSRLPVISICAVRTGCGKSPVTRYLLKQLLSDGYKPVVVRHPMAYGRLENRAVQAYRSMQDLEAQGCTLEEREEYEPLLGIGGVVLAGIDYGQVLELAERSGDVLIWDGGNNDTPFFHSDLEIVLVDPLRPGDELSYYPGYVNLLRADVVIIAKDEGVPAENRRQVMENLRDAAPQAQLLQGDLEVLVADPEAVSGRRVLVVEDGPTISHGGMASGAGMVAAHRCYAGSIVDPRGYAQGSLKQLYTDYPHIGPVVPAMGYTAAQLRDLQDTLAAVPCDLILSATPVDLARLVSVSTPIVRVSYEFVEKSPGTLISAVRRVLDT